MASFSWYLLVTPRPGGRSLLFLLYCPAVPSGGDAMPERATKNYLTTNINPQSIKKLHIYKKYLELLSQYTSTIRAPTPLRRLGLLGEILPLPILRSSQSSVSVPRPLPSLPPVPRERTRDSHSLFTPWYTEIIE